MAAGLKLINLKGVLTWKVNLSIYREIKPANGPLLRPISQYL